jgi:hypothetical protein
VKRDPDCVVNLADRPEHQALKQRLRAQMERELKAQGDPRMFGKGDLFEKYPFANEQQRGLYEKFMRGEKIKAGWINESDIEKEPVK